jgi:hypothetical protein
MKALNGLAALSLSLILGLVPFALIVVDDFEVIKAEVSTAATANGEHALGMEGR